MQLVLAARWLGILELNQVHEFQRLGYKPIYQSPMLQHAVLSPQAGKVDSLALAAVDFYQ